MSLYSAVGSSAAQTKVGNTIGNGSGSATSTIVFVDHTEAGLAENRERGIDSPGWWKYQTYQNDDGTTRHKAELLVFISSPEDNADEQLSDDTIAADFASAIAITGQPTGQTASGGDATFTVTATTTSGTLTFQWQVQTAASTTRWTNVSGATSDSLVLSGQTASDNGRKFRVKVNNTVGGEEKVSSQATLTVS